MLDGLSALSSPPAVAGDAIGVEDPWGCSASSKSGKDDDNCKTPPIAPTSAPGVGVGAVGKVEVVATAAAAAPEEESTFEIESDF